MTATKPEIVRVTDTTPPTLVRDLMEARIRRLMARRAGLADAWPHRAERAELMVEIGVGIDEFNRLVLGR